MTTVQGYDMQFGTNVLGSFPFSVTACRTPNRGPNRAFLFHQTLATHPPCHRKVFAQLEATSGPHLFSRILLSREIRIRCPQRRPSSEEEEPPRALRPKQACKLLG